MHWTLAEATDQGQNKFHLLVVTTGVGAAVAMCGGGSQDNSCVNGNHGILNVRTTGTWTDLTEGAAAAEVHGVNETRRLWVSIMMPLTSTTGNTQTMTLSIRAKLPS